MKNLYVAQEITFLVYFKKALKYNSLNAIEPYLEELWKNETSEFLQILWNRILDCSNNHIWYNPILQKDCVYIGDIQNCKEPFEDFIQEYKLEEVLKIASMTLGDRI